MTSPDRRSFLQGLSGVIVGGLLLSYAFLTKIYNYFFGLHLTDSEKSDLLSRRLNQLEVSTEQQQLALERETNPTLFVAKLAELRDNTGHYFLDYQMNPALAFLDKNGLPLLISAKCTHLGCTVGKDANSQGKILCPCHISYFDIYSGMPDPGSPAKAPLPHFCWILKDKEQRIVARKLADGRIVDAMGKTGGTLSDTDEYSVFISKRDGEIS